MPVVADKHSGPLLAASSVTVTVGGVFMAVTAVEPGKAPRSIWANTWFDIGFICVIIGIMLAAVGVYLNFRRREPSSSAVIVERPMPIPALNMPLPPTPPLLVKILADSRFLAWQSLMIAELHVEVENTTDRDILIDKYEFTCDNEGRPPWDQQATNHERISILQEIERRDNSQEHGQPLRNFVQIAAHNRISGWLLAPVSRNPAGGTPECTVVVRDDIGNRYPAKLPRQEPRTYDPVSS